MMSVTTNASPASASDTAMFWFGSAGMMLFTVAATLATTGSTLPV